MHHTCMLWMVGVVVRMKEIMTMFVDVCKCPVLNFSVPVIMLVGMDVLIMFLIGIFIVVMGVAVRNVVVMLVMMMVLLVRVIMVMGMLMLSMNMSRTGLFYLPFLSFLYE